MSLKSDFNLSCLLVALLMQPSFAQSDVPAQMVQVLTNAKILKNPTYIRATLLENQAVIVTERNAKATDRDCKIDAMLVAKTLVGAFPNAVSRVRIIFNRTDSPKSSQVEVSLGDVRSFEGGMMDAQQLLSTLHLQEVGSDSGSVASAGAKAATVVPGPLLERRLILLGKIEGLRARGTGVKVFQNLFGKIEAEVKAGSDENKLTESVDYLNEKLVEQEQLVRQAAQAGKGSAKTSTGNAAAPIGTSAAAAAPSVPASGASAEAKANEIKSRCDAWDSRLKQWKNEGRDVMQLQATIALMRSWLLDSSKYDLALMTLTGLDKYANNPPPIVH